MFTSQFDSDQNTAQSTPDGSEKKVVKSVCGVDLSGYQCYELKQSDPVYKEYDKSNLHYAINAMQKGLKPPTKIGLRRLNKKRALKKRKLIEKGLNVDVSLHRGALSFFRRARLQQQSTQPTVKPLNPLSPEELCMKSLRTKFRQKMEQKTCDIMDNTSNNSQVRVFDLFDKLKQKQKRHKSRKPKFIRKKESQLKRRAQLLYLVHEYKDILEKLFPAERLEGFNRRTKCPKISRQEIKDALTKHFQQQRSMFSNQQKMTQVVEEKFKELQKKKKQRLERRGLNIGRQQFEQSSSSSSSDDNPERSQSSSSSSEQEELRSDQEQQGRKIVKV